MPAARSATVRELWSLALPAGTTLLAGEAGLGQTVEWVTSLRATFPALGDLQPGYLVLARLSLARQLDEHLTPLFLVEELCQVMAAGLAVNERPDDETIALADRRGLPLLLLPAESDLYRVERDLLRALLDTQAQLARREQEAREHFEARLAREGLNAVLSELAQACSGAVSLNASTGETVATAGSPLTGGAIVQIRYPAHVAGRTLGELVISTNQRRQDAMLSILAQGAADACAVDLWQRLTRRQIEDELGADLVEQLLGDGSAASAACNRLERQGYVLAGDRDHLVVAAPLERQGAGRFEEQLFEDVAWAARRDGAVTLQLAYGAHLLLLISSTAPLEGQVARRWFTEALTRRKDRLVLGVSRIVHSSTELGQAIRQALSALELGSRVTGRASPHWYDDLGLYRVLSDLRDRDELHRFYRETLGSLLQYDEEHGAELVHTLQVFFEQNANASQAARALYVHRNTLNYRLQRIVEISGCDLDDADTRLTLQLALKLHRLMVS